MGDVATTAEVKRPGGLLGLHYRMYDWVLRLSGHRNATGALFLLAAAEASFFPVPPDVLLMAMCLARPLRFWYFALVCTLGSVVGGVVGWLIGWGAWNLIEGWVFDNLGFMGFTPEHFATVQGLYQSNAFLALFGAAFSPIPFKVFTIAAGVFHIGLPVLLVASTVGRGLRFLLVASVLRIFGPPVKKLIDRYLGILTLLFVILLIGGFWLVGKLGGH